ncbi:putative SNF2/RAD54 related DNA helicase [Leptomonas pyrrhocoris]|uniref:Putative SNF2/RAD54 related DNA helicase n=1 Tax=Leptomonas pyrrhocoris TaxID=157538 RepID=A0A0M9FVN1_LEPPY|nr:putative SNF2/RAD54 related DNA helicase [Leptomonas pyrrhocoris]KPA76887.1 putative SNF2/RAD54 related DNA helicase [Leptomonas pyrrhocoris]|eukprot:XP_015655326.1 putative SNF2/RAD54 related DNA helicase [Leptomonas pyrrhocoris]
MEAVLDVKTCLRCGAPFTFRLSRFGCVFACPCGERIDAVKAAALFTENLRTRRQFAEFIPIISSPLCDLTDSLKVAEVEMNWVKSEFVVQFRNFSEADVLRVSHCFSLALREHIQLAQTTVSGPMDLVDSLVDELREAAEEPQCLFFVDPPATELRSAANEIASCGVTENLLDNIPVELFRALKMHQLEGVKKALQLKGRVLFADDMGVGKTLQAVATVAALEAFPLLIVCPSAVKFMWADQIEQYLHEQVRVDEIHIINGANDTLDCSTQPKVVLTSYHMAAVLERQLLRRDWKCVVCDESHVLHTNASGSDAMYTRAVTAMGKQAPYCLLLSGTPALSSPFDMYNQIDMLRPGLLGPTRFHFAMRYCHITLSPFLRVGESSRPTEVSSLLSSCCMIRRLKSDVLELPVKTRVVLRVADHPSFDARRGGASGEATYQARYASSWKMKWSGIVEAVDYCCAKYDRVVLLAHHIELIDALVKLLQRRSKSIVRIDGRVPAPQRGNLLEKFHAGEARLAVVGITACAVGISLAPASCAVFCELPPDAVWMTQAEDRLHRPGQANEVIIYYLLGVHSEFDAELFARLCRNLREVGSVVSQDGDGKLVLSQASHEARSCLGTAQLRTALLTHAPHDAHLVEEPLLFSISKNTGRVHIRACDAAAFYTTLLWNEANECVRQRQSPIWKQLDTFLTSFTSLTPFQQRQMCLGDDWLPALFNWKTKYLDVGHVKRLRYAKANMIGWGIWWEVRRQYFSKHYYYFGPLQYVEDAYKVCCLNCEKYVLDFNTQSEMLLPGAVCRVNGDTELFCSGKCRENFYFKRSSSAIRRTVASVDKSVCAYCHVDCEALCIALASAARKQRRLKIIRRLHPHLLQYPALYERIIAHPEPGNIWQADHITPVASGGGEASLDNVQTLCILCHTLKTKEDVKHMKQYEAEVSPSAAVSATTVSAAVMRCSSPVHKTRVSRRRLSRPP